MINAKNIQQLLYDEFISLDSKLVSDLIILMGKDEGYSYRASLLLNNNYCIPLPLNFAGIEIIETQVVKGFKFVRKSDMFFDESEAFKLKNK